jgi:hypothetical protein
MSSAGTQMRLVSVLRMEVLARELRQLQSGMDTKQARLELVRSELAIGLHHDGEQTEVATPTATASHRASSRRHACSCQPPTLVAQLYPQCV